MTCHRVSPAVFCSALLFSALAGSASAHHGTAVSYDQNSWATVTGTVTEFRWRNPHSALFLDVSDAEGATVNYAIELASPVLMTRSVGWTRATFKPGDLVEFRVHPSRTDAPVGECLFSCVVKVNGVELPSEVASEGN
ncbi:MAG: hypothetical protein LBF16_14295 [Pseudomonadales bacterium]|jgi:hypothetical protein|nr:hypothetical protein [Pseudomonadales bacterium]